VNKHVDIKLYMIYLYWIMGENRITDSFEGGDYDNVKTIGSEPFWKVCKYVSTLNVCQLSYLLWIGVVVRN
jgi:hypothetical protein